MRLSLLSMVCGAIGITLGTLAGAKPADAMPLAPVAAVENGNALGSTELAQYRPGYHRERAYRRELRHYRNKPGARFILKNKRNVYCRNVPSRC